MLFSEGEKFTAIKKLANFRTQSYRQLYIHVGLHSIINNLPLHAQMLSMNSFRRLLNSYLRNLSSKNVIILTK